MDPLPFPYLSAPPPSDLGSGAKTDDIIFSDCGSDDLNDPFENDSKDNYVEPDPQVKGIIQTYLASVKENLVKEIRNQKMPNCYKAKTFWISPPDHFFALKKSQEFSDGLNPTSFTIQRYLSGCLNFLMTALSLARIMNVATFKMLCI